MVGIDDKEGTKTMRTRQTAVLTSAVLSVLSLLNTSLGQESVDQLHLEGLFAKALVGDGKLYTSVRQDILADKGATVFLSAKAENTNLLARVLARAMLSWETDAATNIWRNDRIIASLDVMLASAASPLQKIQSELDAIRRTVTSSPAEEASAVVLLEIALKGPTIPMDPKYRRVPSDGMWVRCVAAGLAGTYADPDVPRVLAILAKDASQACIRACAMTGLRKTETPQAVELLISGLSDNDKSVQEAAHLGLKRLTHQDFGTDQRKYQDWWEENRTLFPNKR